jgi:hypothetical protein
VGTVLSCQLKGNSFYGTQAESVLSTGLKNTLSSWSAAPISPKHSPELPSNPHAYSRDKTQEQSC